MEKSFVTHNPIWPMCLWLVVILLMLSFQSASKVLGRIWEIPSPFKCSTATASDPYLSCFCLFKFIHDFLPDHPPVLFDFQMYWVPSRFSHITFTFVVCYGWIGYEALVFSTSSSMCNPLGPAGCWEISLTRLPLGSTTASDQGQRGLKGPDMIKAYRGHAFVALCCGYLSIRLPPCTKVIVLADASWSKTLLLRCSHWEAHRIPLKDVPVECAVMPAWLKNADKCPTWPLLKGPCIDFSSRWTTCILK